MNDPLNEFEKTQRIMSRFGYLREKTPHGVLDSCNLLIDPWLFHSALCNVTIESFGDKARQGLIVLCQEVGARKTFDKRLLQKKEHAALNRAIFQGAQQFSALCSHKITNCNYILTAPFVEGC